MARRRNPALPLSADMRRLRAGVTDGRPDLGTFLARLRGLHPDIDVAIDGIYCGREGIIREPIGSWGRTLNFNWYSNDVRKNVVEWAYIS